MPSAMLLADRYRLDSRISVGGAGEVWRGTDVVLERPVAVKLLREEYGQHAETLARFRAEARHAGSLSHRGIAQIYDYGEGDTAHPPYLVMELVDGPSLAGLLARGPLDPAQAMDLVAQTASTRRATIMEENPATVTRVCPDPVTPDRPAALCRHQVAGPHRRPGKPRAPRPRCRNRRRALPPS